jgi:tRNA(adenine34) deaminase
MCSFPIRETRIARVVYAISSPMMGGFSKWNVLGDHEISNVMPEMFGDKPEVAAGLHYRQAAAVWQKWNPVFWLAIRLRGCLADPANDGASLTLQIRQPQRRLLRRLLARASQFSARKRQGGREGTAIPVRSDMRSQETI